MIQHKFSDPNERTSFSHPPSPDAMGCSSSKPISPSRPHPKGTSKGMTKDLHAHSDTSKSTRPSKRPHKSHNNPKRKSQKTELARRRRSSVARPRRSPRQTLSVGRESEEKEAYVSHARNSGELELRYARTNRTDGLWPTVSRSKRVPHARK